MPRWAVVVLSVLAGVAIVVVLGFVFLGGADEGTEVTAGTTTTTETETITTETITTEATTTAEPAERELRITIRDGEPVGGIQQLTVQLGEEVKVRVESDVAEELHVHGYDLTADVEAGEDAEIEFEATIAGRFEIELEDSGTPIAELEVRP
jgi:preprotein translocase subunit SecF